MGSMLLAGRLVALFASLWSISASTAVWVDFSGASGGSALRTVFRGNSALEGPGVDGAQLERCVVFGNLGVGVLHSGVETVSDSIVRGNSGGQIQSAGVVRYSNIEGAHAGVGNIDADPPFWDEPSGDFHL